MGVAYTDARNEAPGCAPYDPVNLGLPHASSAAFIGPTPGQLIVAILAGGALVTGLAFAPSPTGRLLVAALWWLFLVLSVWRLTAVIVSAAPPPPVPEVELWPRYTVVAALRHEAGMIDQLVERLARLDYPADRLEGFLALEADDAETIAAAEKAARPAWLSVLIVPPGRPQTKPRALNFALSHSTGALLTVYDAEDDPDPLQLREAAARFASGDPRLACLQAPLRIRGRTGVRSKSAFLDRQFAAEYAALFEVMLPAMARLGLPFPLGGTSNHFRVDVLRRIGGWDAFNVTEDADLGFRLSSAGWRLGVLQRPTHETPPGDLAHWLPQRTRWLKGYMQTWGVHMRAPWKLGLWAFIAFQLSLGQAILSALLHAVTVAWVITALLVTADAGLSPEAPWLALATLMLGVAAAWLTCAIGARRAGIAYGPIDMASAPAYWAMQSAAFAHAAWRLVLAPHAWDKTAHTPEVVSEPVVAEPLAIAAAPARIKTTGRRTA